MKHEREKWMKDTDQWDIPSDHDPLFNRVMTSLNPTYAALARIALETGLDEDARRVFSYVTDAEIEIEDNDNPDDNDNGDRTYCVGQMESPDSNLLLIMCATTHLHSPFSGSLTPGPRPIVHLTRSELQRKEGLLVQRCIQIMDLP